MGSVKFKDLKAYVRYDGNGRVVAGSMVFRKKKPKNGRWYEISSNLCCNAGPNPGTTTTTTTTQGGGGTPTPSFFEQSYWVNRYDSCITTSAGTLGFYSASPTLTPGMTIYTDAALTTPVTEGYVFYNPMNMSRYIVGAGGVVSLTNCTGIVQVLAAIDGPTVCAFGGNPVNISYDAGIGFCNVSSIYSTNFSTYFNAYDIMYVANPEGAGYRMFSLQPDLVTANSIFGGCSSC